MLVLRVVRRQVDELLVSCRFIGKVAQLFPLRQSSLISQRLRVVPRNLVFSSVRNKQDEALNDHSIKKVEQAGVTLL